MMSHAFCIFPSGVITGTQEDRARGKGRSDDNPFGGDLAADEATHTRGAHAQFNFLEKLLKEHVKAALDAVGDDMWRWVQQL